jgi:3-hydroxyisobutyrate dehydrogenase
MARIAFIGLGNMGLPMAINLVNAGHEVHGFDLVATSMSGLKDAGGHAATTPMGAVEGAEVVVTMLPAGAHVRSVYETDVFGRAPKGTLLIDCSTIDVATARDVAEKAGELGLEMIDAPVSGGTAGASGGTLTFMVGGPEDVVAKAKPYLEIMGATIVHAGGPGNGQAAKICNNMMLGINMLGVCEGYAMAEKLGLDTKKLFEISSKSSGQSWAMTSYNPVPGLVETAASNRDFAAGFSGNMMLKDLSLAQDASTDVNASTPLGSEARKLFRDYVESGHGDLDFSGIIKMIRGE